MDELVGVLFRLLDRNDGTIRHHVVKTLCELGLERKDVILKLVPKKVIIISELTSAKLCQFDIVT